MVRNGIVFAGFLGSGKTSLILGIAKELAKRKVKTAILVNEIGEIGVDGEFLRTTGAQTYEITEGCICCTLKKDLESTLSELVSNYRPDAILVEPTGIAFPSVVAKVLGKYTSSTLVVGVVDAVRFAKLYREMREFVERQLREAKIIAINKIDAVRSKAELETIAEITRQINPNSKPLFVSAKTKEGFEEFLRELFAEEIKEETGEEPDLDVNSIAEAGAYWFSKELYLKFESPISAFFVKKILEEILNRIKGFGDPLHYKIVVSSHNGVLKVGITDKTGIPSFDGEIAGWVKECKMKALFVDKSLSNEKIGSLFEEHIFELSKSFKFKLEALVEKKHDHAEVKT